MTPGPNANGDAEPVQIHGLEVCTYECSSPEEPDYLQAKIKIGEKDFGCTIVLPPDWRTSPKSFHLALHGMRCGLMSIVEKELTP